MSQIQRIARKCGDWSTALTLCMERSMELPDPLRARIVLANGVYDGLHPGHVANLAEAADLGDVLVVSLDADEDVRQLKGRAPTFEWRERALMVACLSFVTAITWHTRRPCWRRPVSDCSLPSLIRFLAADVWAARGSEPLPAEEIAAAVSAHTEIHRLPRHGLYSSTAIQEQFKAQTP